MDDQLQAVPTDVPAVSQQCQFTQTGNDNMMVPNYGTVNITVQMTPQMMQYQMPVMPGGFYVPLTIDREYYNLFVLGIEEFEKPYFTDLTNFVRQEYGQYKCYPPGRLIFNAFNLCPFDKVKVVIIGQDPYHEPGQAHGLSFSVNDGVPFPPSLQNIFKEISDDLGTPMPQSGDLTRWAEQGVLLLNATLTVRAHQAASHQRKGWETFTDAAIKALNVGRDNLVFILWGGYAR